MTTNESNVTPASGLMGENKQINTDEVPFALRLVVYGLGVAIAVMLGLIVYGFSVGFDGEDSQNAGVTGKAEGLQVAPEAIRAARPITAAAVQVPQPAGFELASSSYANGALIMHFRKEALGDKPAEMRILILDLASGAVQTIELVTSTAP